MKKLTDNEIAELLQNETKFFSAGDVLSVEEVSDGNINYVYRIKNQNNKSIILKQSCSEIRTSGNPLDVDRSRIEMNALIYENSVVKSSTPELIYCNQEKHIIVMEDLYDYDNLRYALINEKIFTTFKSDISEFLVKTLLLSTDLVIDPLIKKEKVKQFINPMLCQISEKLVFSEPYDEEVNRNIINEKNKEFFKKELYNDNQLRLKVAKIKNKFKNYAQSLLHGDLHTGSIFVKNGKTKVLDPEFSFYGPAGYDIGNVIANLIFTYVRCKNISNNKKFLLFLEDSIEYIIDDFYSSGLNLLKEKATDRSTFVNGFYEDYLNDILLDSSQMAGTELIRRTVGDSKVVDIQTIENFEAKCKAERECVLIGKELIMNSNKYVIGSEYVKLLRSIYVQS